MSISDTKLIGETISIPPAQEVPAIIGAEAPLLSTVFMDRWEAENEELHRPGYLILEGQAEGRSLEFNFHASSRHKQLGLLSKRILISSIDVVSAAQDSQFTLGGDALFADKRIECCVPPRLVVAELGKVAIVRIKYDDNTIG